MEKPTRRWHVNTRNTIETLPGLLVAAEFVFRLVVVDETADEQITLPAVDQVDVHPSIVVVIQKGATCAGGFRQIVFWRAAIHVAPTDTTRGGSYFFKQRPVSRLLWWPGTQQSTWQRANIGEL